MASVPGPASIEGSGGLPSPGAAAVDWPPYDPGPVSRLIAWIAGHGWLGWLIVFALAAAQFAWCHALLWSIGRPPAWDIDVVGTTLLVYGPYALGLAVIGRRVARRALNAFWPATGWPAEAKPAWTYQFDFAPGRGEWIAIAIGSITGIVVLLSTAPATTGSDRDRLVSLVAYAPLYLVGYGLPAAVFWIVGWWLWVVARIHRGAKAIDPFDRAPIYAFSRFTVFVGLTIVIAAYYTVVVNGGVLLDNTPRLLYGLATVVVGIVAFVAPLWGIHDRLVDEKARLALDVERRITATQTELYARVDARTYDDAKSVGDTLESLTLLRGRVDGIPTWPWSPALLRGFVSALLLPIVIPLASRLLTALTAS